MTSLLARSVLRWLLGALGVLVFATTAPGCGWIGDDIGVSQDQLAIAPNVYGYAGNRVRQLKTQEALDLRFVSYDKILTWEGLVEDFGTAESRVHLVDTKRFDGHYGYTRKALGRPHLSEDQFRTEVQFPATRKYMPFIAFDLRDQPIRVEGKTFNWVMQIRRYDYRDSEKEIANFAVQLKKLLSNRLMKGYGEPLLFVWSGNQTYAATGLLLRPHVTQVTELRAKGFEVISEKELIRKADGNLVSVLNPGVAYGHLTLVKSGNTEVQERLTPRHIAVFQETPERVPPVAGIVTLEPQTPLSHVNLLAKNRGTPNVSTAQLSLIPRLEGLLGKLVRMEAKANGKIEFTRATEADAAAFWASHHPVDVDVPTIVPVSLDAVEFATSDAASLGLPNIGSKASNYAVIQKVLGPQVVRPGFALGFAHYRKIIAGSPAEPLIADLVAKKDTLPPEQIDARLDAIRDAIEKATPPENLTATVAAIRQISARLPGIARLRFRSSTNSEDLPVFNGAGLYESRGFDVADDDVKLAEEILDVMSSLWLARAFWERELFGIDHAAVGMAVLINAAFSDEYANGVVVGSVGPHRFRTWVNAQLGEASVTNPLEGEIPESFTVVTPAAGGIEIAALESHSNLGDVFLERSGAGVRPAVAPVLQQLHEITEKLHGHFVAERVAAGDTRRYGIDIEYKLMKEGDQIKLYVKQSRLLAL